MNYTCKKVGKRLKNSPDYQCLMRYYKRHNNLKQAESEARKKGDATAIMQATTMRIRLEQLIREQEERIENVRHH